MGDIIDLTGWTAKHEEYLMNKLSKEYEELAYDIIDKYEPQGFAKALMAIVKECRNDSPSLMFIICIVDIIRLISADYYLEMVITKGYEEKVIKPLTDFLTRSTNE